MSFKITHDSPMLGPSQRMLPKITPVSVEETLMVALMLWKPCGAMVKTEGRSTIFRSPSVAKSMHRFWRVFGVWLTRRTSGGDMSNVSGLVADPERTEHDVESMHLDEGLGIDRVGEASKLGYSAEVRHEVFLNLRSTSGLADIFVVLQILSEVVPE